MDTKTQKKVLIVDDDKFLLDMYCIKFKKNGFEVSSANNGMEGLAVLRGGFVPDILMSDIVMPTMDGFEFLETVRAEKLDKGAVIIVLSNQGQKSDIDRAKQIGIQGYIVKASSIPSEVVDQVTQMYEANKPQK